MNIQTIHPAPAQVAAEHLRPTPEVQENAVNAVTGRGEAPGITAVQKNSGAGENGFQGELLDRFAPEEPLAKAGLYRMAKGEDGKPTLLLEGQDNTAKEAAQAGENTPAAEQEAAEETALEQEAKEAEKAEKADSDKKAEESKAKTTAINTDRVDREIRQLEEDVEEIAWDLRTAIGDEAEALEQKLILSKIELRIKDNDTYRRAHAQVTSA